MMDILTTIGTFIDKPPRGVVIAFCWVFSPLMTLAVVQRIKRLAKAEGWNLSAACIEGCAIFLSWSIAMLIMSGLYSLDFRPAVIHAILISGVYTSAASWWMGWAKVHRPDMYQAFRTDRRADDTGEFKPGELK